MAEMFLEVSKENFEKFFSQVYGKHHSGEINPSFNYQIDKWSSFLKDYANQILENYYGMHYCGISPKNKELYIFNIINKKLFSAARLKYNI